MKALCFILAVFGVSVLIGFTTAHSDALDSMIIVLIFFGSFCAFFAGLVIDNRMPLPINITLFLLGFALLASATKDVSEVEIFIYVGKLTWILNGGLYAVGFALLGLVCGRPSSS